MDIDSGRRMEAGVTPSIYVIVLKRLILEELKEHGWLDPIGNQSTF